MKLRLTLDVEYDDNSVGLEELSRRLQGMVASAAGDGAFTGDTEAEVYTWSSSATRIPGTRWWFVPRSRLRKTLRLRSIDKEGALAEALMLDCGSGYVTDENPIATTDEN